MSEVDLGDVRIHVEEHGQGQPLVLVHGLGTHSGLWKHQEAEFSSGHRLITLDLRGFGSSSKPSAPGSYSVEVLAQDVAGVIRKLGLSRVHLLGASMGGFIAQVIGLEHPELVRSLVLCHTGPRMSIPEDIMASRLVSLDATPMSDYGKLVAGQALASDPDPRVFEWLAEMIGNNDKRSYRQVLIEGLRDFDIADRVGEIAKPTLVIVGDQDRVIPPEEGGELARRIPGAEIVTLRRVGHIGYAEQPERFNGAVLGFLRGLVAEQA